MAQMGRQAIGLTTGKPFFPLNYHFAQVFQNLELYALKALYLEPGGGQALREPALLGVLCGQVGQELHQGAALCGHQAGLCSVGRILRALD